MVCFDWGEEVVTCIYCDSKSLIMLKKQSDHQTGIEVLINKDAGINGYMLCHEVLESEGQ